MVKRRPLRYSLTTKWWLNFDLQLFLDRVCFLRLGRFTHLWIQCWRGLSEINFSLVEVRKLFNLWRLRSVLNHCLILQLVRWRVIEDLLCILIGVVVSIMSALLCSCCVVFAFRSRNRSHLTNLISFGKSLTMFALASICNIDDTTISTVRAALIWGRVRNLESAILRLVIVSC